MVVPSVEPLDIAEKVAWMVSPIAVLLPLGIHHGHFLLELAHPGDLFLRRQRLAGRWHVVVQGVVLLAPLPVGEQLVAVVHPAPLVLIELRLLQRPASTHLLESLATDPQQLPRLDGRHHRASVVLVQCAHAGRAPPVMRARYIRSMATAVKTCQMAWPHGTRR